MLNQPLAPAPILGGCFFFIEYKAYSVDMIFQIFVGNCSIIEHIEKIGERCFFIELIRDMSDVLCKIFTN